jgi:transglutaminase-like putative cysteine protease
VKTVITCPISKATLCADFMARETQRRRPIHRDCRYFQHVDRRIVWNFPQDPRLLWKQTKSLILKIRAGYDIAFNCIQQVPMLLMLSVHPSRRSDLLSDDRIEFSPKVRARDFKDAFGNICSRLVAPTGLLEVRNEFTIADSGEPDISARPTPRSGPLMPYRTTHSYICSAADIATPKSCRILRWSMFGRVEGGWARAQAICQYVHDRIKFGYHHARDDRTASEGHEERIGVCPDFAHSL